MSIIWIILKILIFTGILTVIAKQSYNFIFLMGKKPVVWIFCMLLLNFLFFLIGSNIQDSFNVVWWSSLLTLFAMLPPKKNEELQSEINEAVKDFYEEMGISNGKLKYRLGLISYSIGGIIGWVMFYGKIVQAS